MKTERANFQTRQNQKNWPFFVLFLLCFVWSENAFSAAADQSGESVRLSIALAEALKSGPRAAAVRAQLGVTRAGILTASQAPNPVVFMDRGLMAEQVMRLGPIFSTDKPFDLYLRLLAARVLTDQTKVDLLTQIWSLRTDVRKAYIELVLALETQRTLEQLYQLSDRLYMVSKKRFDAGAVPELDVLKGRLAVSQANVDVQAGLRRITAAKQQLNLLMGRVVDASISVAPLPDYTGSEPVSGLRTRRTDVLPDFSRDVAPLKLFVEAAIQSRLELKSLGLQKRVNSTLLQGHYSSLISNPGFALGKDTAGNPVDGPKITAVFMTINEEVPLNNFQQGGIYQHKAVATQLRFQTEAQRNMIYSDVSASYQNLLAARDKIRVYQESLLQDSNEVTRLAQRSYEVGQSDITAALQAQQANIQVRADYLNAINDYATAIADLEKAVGRPLQ